jgi:hypothetical protein
MSGSGSAVYGIFKEKPGVMSVYHVWVCIDAPYLYTSKTLIGLLIDVIMHWHKDDRLVG